LTRGELARIGEAVTEAFSGDDLDGMLALCHPDIEWRTTGMYLEPGTYRGREGIRQYLGPLTDELPDMRVDIDVLVDEGERGVLYWRASGHGRASGAPVALDVFSTIEVRDGLI
jgi:ketosteroid isomerase-like protein